MTATIKINEDISSFKWDAISDAVKDKIKDRVQKVVEKYLKALQEQPSAGNFLIDLEQKTISLNGEKQTIDADVTLAYLTALFLKRNVGEAAKITNAVVERGSHKETEKFDSGQNLAGVQMDDIIATLRNTLSAVVPADISDSETAEIDISLASITLIFALYEIYSGGANYYVARDLGDKVGKIRGQLKVASGAVVSIGTVFYIISEALNNPLVATAARSIFGAGSLLTLASSGWAAWRCNKFRRQLNDVYNTAQRQSSDIVEPVKRTLQFLVDELKATTGTLKEEKTKERELKRKISQDGVARIKQDAQKYLDEMKDPAKVKKAAEKGFELIQKVKKDNRIKTGLHGLSFVAGLMSIIALILTCFVPGALPAVALAGFLLYVIAGGISFVLTIGLIIAAVRRILKARDLAALEKMKNDTFKPTIAGEYALANRGIVPGGERKGNHKKEGDDEKYKKLFQLLCNAPRSSTDNITLTPEMIALLNLT